MRSETFGRLLKAGISSIANCEGKTSPVIEEDLGQQIGVAAASIQRYKSGHLPPESRTVQLLTEACVRRGFLGREWAQRFLFAAKYPNGDKLLDQLYPTSSSYPRSPRLYDNLPAPTYNQFVMRSQAFADVIDGLQQRSAVVLIASLGGMGKTSLAREVAAKCMEDYPDVPRFDAAVWVSDKDRPGTINLSIVLNEIARTLDYPGFTQFEHEEKRREVEQLLRRQRVLLVVDNFETITDSALLSWLLRLPEPSKAIITSREKQRIFWSTWLVELRGMNETEAQVLIEQRLRQLKMEQLVSKPSQLEPLLAATGGNPKAIEVALGLVKHERRPLQNIVDDLYVARGELFDDLFSRAWGLLDEAARQVLMVLSFFPTSASIEALSATADVHGFAFHRAIEWLADLALFDVQQQDLNSSPRYALHPLVRAFAGAKLVNDPMFAQHARKRWMVFFQVLAAECHSDGWDLPYQFERAERDIDNFQAIIQIYFETQQWQQLIELVIAIRMYWNTRGYYKERNGYVDMALQAAQALNDIQAQVQLLAVKVRTLCYLGEVQLAIQCCSYARELLNRLNGAVPSLIESVNEAEIRICFRTGDVNKQLELAQLNVESAETRSSTRAVLHRYYIADYLYLVGKYNEAEVLFLELIEESQVYGYQRAMITGWLSLAQIALHKQEIEACEVRLERAQQIAQGIQHRRYLAEAHRVRAELRLLQDDFAGAHMAFTNAIDLFERLGMRRELIATREELRRIDSRFRPQTNST